MKKNKDITTNRFGWKCFLRCARERCCGTSALGCLEPRPPPRIGPYCYRLNQLALLKGKCGRNSLLGLCKACFQDTTRRDGFTRTEDAHRAPFSERYIICSLWSLFLLTNMEYKYPKETQKPSTIHKCGKSHARGIFLGCYFGIRMMDTLE